MGRLFQWVFRLFAAAMVLVFLAVLTIYFFVASSLPEYDKELQVQGLNQPVEIVRDAANVPHILGTNDADTFFALGYVHAQDRLWQMMLLRRTAQGRLSEAFGADLLPEDRLLRTLDIYGLARSSVDVMRPDTRAVLDAYAAGVNARLTEINAEGLGRGAPEFFMFSAPIAPWQAADSVAIVKLMALQLASHSQSEALHAKLSLLLDQNRLADILPKMPGDGVATLPDYASLVPGVPPGAVHPAPDRDHQFAALSPIKADGFTGASNIWAATPDRSARKGSLLANDPHLGLTAPTLWYLARLDLASGSVIGGTIPGLPTVLVGRSEHIGWGLTTAYVDDEDLFVEQLNPDNPNQYLTPSGYKDFETRQSIIQVKDAAPETINLRWTDNGPVLPGFYHDIEQITPTGHVMSLSWTALSGQDTSFEAGLDLMRSQNVAQALEGSMRHVAPPQNLVVVDAENIAMRVIGALPKRSVLHETKGQMPSPGWKIQNRWQGMFAPSVNPVFENPQGGIVVNTNNKSVDRPFPQHISYEWGDSQRIQRFAQLMQRRQTHTRESFVEAQLDVVSPTARTLLPLMGQDLWFNLGSPEPGSFEDRRKTALDLLAGWNGEMNEHMPEPLIYAAWLRALKQRMVADELGPMVADVTDIDPIFYERVYRDISGASQWCDVQQTTSVETCKDVSLAALDDAVHWLDETYGGSMEALRWGDAHMAAHKHPVLGDVPVINWFVNIFHSTSGGNNTLQRAKYSEEGENPFHNIHAGGYRGVYDFADPESSLFISSTGQSGHPLSQFYDNLGEYWRQGEYIPMTFDLDIARAGSAGTTMLIP